MIEPVNPDARLVELNLDLPEPEAFPGRLNLVPFVVVDKMAFLSGLGPITPGGPMRGALGDDLTVEEGYEVARYIAMRALGRIRDHFGTLDAVDRWVKVLGFIRSAGAFDQQPAVLNGFTDLIVDVYGSERGRSARSAIGTSHLPLGIPVEVEAIVTLR